jgi:hypothetical protein
MTPNFLISGTETAFFWLLDVVFFDLDATTLYNKLKESGSVTQLELLKGYWHAKIFMGYNTPDHVPTMLIKKFLTKHLTTQESLITN